MFEDFVNFLIDQFYFIIINTKQLIIRIHTIVMLNKLIKFESNIINCFTTMIRLALKFLETELCWNETIYSSTWSKAPSTLKTVKLGKSQPCTNFSINVFPEPKAPSSSKTVRLGKPHPLVLHCENYAWL